MQTLPREVCNPCVDVQCVDDALLRLNPDWKRRIAKGAKKHQIKKVGTPKAQAAAKWTVSIVFNAWFHFSSVHVENCTSPQLLQGH